MAFDKTDTTAQKRSRWLRWGVLAAVLAGMTAIVYGHQYVKGAGKPVGVDALCPFGGIETLFSVITGAGLIQKIAVSSIILLIGTIVVALIYRRSFCGQICPLGALQGIFGALGGKLFKKRPTVPRPVDRVARYLKYAILAFFAVWTFQAAELVMRPYDPWVAYAHLTSSELWAEFAVGVVVLGVSLAGSVVYERFFCKYACPMGAFLGLFSKVSIFGIKRDADACIDCSLCDKACPMNIEVSKADKVTASECISCNECVNACPAAGALEVKAPGGTKVSPALMTGVTVLGIGALIVATTLTGQFQWRMPTLAESIEQMKNGTYVPPAESTGGGHEGEASESPEAGAPDAAGVDAGSEGGSGGVSGSSTSGFDTSVIKGYMSMQEISEATGVPAEKFTEKWGVPASDLGKPMKEIKDQYGFSPDDVKVWVGEQMSQ